MRFQGSSSLSILHIVILFTFFYNKYIFIIEINRFLFLKNGKSVRNLVAHLESALTQEMRRWKVREFKSHLLSGRARSVTDDSISELKRRKDRMASKSEHKLKHL